MDHVVPLARGGKSNKKNCVVSCKACNSQKGHLMSVELTMAQMQQVETGLVDDHQSENDLLAD